jgi:hypothetical protein
VVAVAVAALAAFDAFSSHEHYLQAAVVGVIAVLAFTLVRERYQRDRLAEVVERKLTVGDTLQQAVQDTLDSLQSPYGWETLQSTFNWTLSGPRGADCRYESLRVLRFVRNEMFVVYEFCKGDGNTEQHKCWQRVPTIDDGQLTTCDQPLAVAAEGVPGPRGQKYRLISLGGMFSRGETFDLVTTRHLRNSFAENRESISISPDVPTYDIEFAVTWPEQVRPTNVQFSDGAFFFNVDEELALDGQGRWSYKGHIQTPKLHGRYELRWIWPPEAERDPVVPAKVATAVEDGVVSSTGITVPIQPGPNGG